MEAGKPSQSAINAAMARATHLILDSEPKVLCDSYALGFSGLQNGSALIAANKAYYDRVKSILGEEFARAFSQSYRAFAVIRQRYAEDELDKAIKRGVSQYVILGAGLDSFVFRRCDLEGKLRVFEVDLLSTQEWKKARLHELGISQPRNLTFVPVDFEKQSLNSELRAHDCHTDMPVFFSWLGVTQYLTEEAVFQTLRQVVSAAPGSEIVFEYVLVDSLLNDREKVMTASGRALPAEPWLSQFDPVALSEELKQMGFADVEDFGQEEANSRYLAGRSDEISKSALEGLSWSLLKIAHLMKARVGI